MAKKNMKMKKVYLDNAATTKIDQQVAKVIDGCAKENYGNASSIHSFGVMAGKELEKARERIANSINARADEIIFTSGGTESNNLAILGVLKKVSGKRKQVIISKIEHPSVMNLVKQIKEWGFEVGYAEVDSKGIVELDKLKKLVNENTALVSVMHANNEIGTIQPIEEIGKLCRKFGAIFHSDAVQSYMKVKIDVVKMNVDLMSFSGHKIHGPNGIGALYVRKGVSLSSLIVGGGQERGLRAGTENVPAIAGFGKAVELWNEKDLDKIKRIRDKIISRVLNEIKGARLNGDREERIVNNAHFSFDFVEGEAIVLRLDARGIAVSTGSACSSHELKPSYVLLAMGLKQEQTRGSIRVSLSRNTSEEEADYFVDSLKEVVGELRKDLKIR